MKNHSPRHLTLLCVFFLCLSFGCRNESSLPRHTDFRVGMNRAAVLEGFGPPAHIQTFVKSDDAIWGPIEHFWDEVPFGATVEVWSYRSVHRVAEDSAQRVRGKTELYFVAESDSVRGIGFAMDGAVYEGEN